MLAPAAAGPPTPAIPPARLFSTPVAALVDNSDTTSDAPARRPTPGPVDAWDRTSATLRSTMAEVTWNMWFRDVRPLRLSDGLLVLGVPSSLAAEKIRSTYLPLLTSVLREEYGEDLGIDLVVETVPRETGHASTAPPAPGDDPAAGAPPERATATPAESKSGPPHTPAFETRRDPAALNERYTFDRFVIGASNRFSHAAALAVAEQPARNYNPLFIYGPAGLGKTHLLHAIGNYVKDVHLKRVRYITTETFMNEFVDATRYATFPEFRRRHREVDVLLVDDIQFLEHSEKLQEEFFHTFNHLHNTHNQIVISSDRPPKLFADVDERLRTRFEWGLITNIEPPDFETRLAILRMKADADQLEGIPDEVLTFIADNISDNVRKLEGALTRVAARSSLYRTALTEEMAREVLADQLSGATPRTITPDLILTETADMFGWSIEDLRGKSRRRPLVTARQISMYVFRELTDYSYPRIGEEFGGRDHTTVMHAVDKITTLMAERHSVFEQVNELISRLKLGTGG